MRVTPHSQSASKNLIRSYRSAEGRDWGIFPGLEARFQDSSRPVRVFSPTGRPPITSRWEAAAGIGPVPVEQVA